LGAIIGRYLAARHVTGAWIVAGVLLLALVIASSLATLPRLPTGDEIARAAMHPPHETNGFDRN
jgi:hypothetical protein